MGAPAGGAQFTWTKPEAWTEAPASQMRVANFTAGPEGKVEAYLTVLPGGGGGVESNLNRWRKQMGLEPFSPEEVAALERVQVVGHEAVVADIAGTFKGMSGDQNNENYRMLGAIFEHDGAAVFAKMTGPADAVAAERENFLAFVKSLQPQSGGGMPAAGNLPPGHPPIEGAPAGPDMSSMPADAAHGQPEIGAAAINLEWALPEGWTKGADRPVRLATFAPAPNTECYITVLPSNAGGIEANVNLWRQQLGQAALTTDELQALPKLDVMGEQAPLVEVQGNYSDMSGTQHDNYTLLGLIRPMEDRTMFVKLVGPADEVQAQRDNFMSFCQSLKLPGQTAAPASAAPATEAPAGEAPAADPEPAAAAEAAPEAPAAAPAQ